MKRIVYKEQNGKLLKGFAFNVLLLDRYYHLVDLIAYADGSLYCQQEIDMDKLRELLESGKLTLTLPENKRLFIPYIGYIEVAKSFPNHLGNAGFVELIQETIKRMNSEVDQHMDHCISAFRAYLITPNDANLNALKEVYDLIRDDCKGLFEMDQRKDPLIRLMTSKQVLTEEERESLLNDYFEGEWIELNKG